MVRMSILLAVFLLFAAGATLTLPQRILPQSEIAGKGTHNSSHPVGDEHNYLRHANYTKLQGKYEGKIAFLFLSKRGLFHEYLWEIFFTWHAPPTHYSIYWHPTPDYVPPPDSIFKDHVIKTRVPTAWASFSLNQAHRELMKAALVDPLNEYFVLVSESCVPLVPFSVMYRTIMPFKRTSIVNACPLSPDLMEINRWKPLLDQQTLFKKEHWRKSSQWSALSRKHAQVVVNDTDLAPFFYTIVPSDEHYVPSLLAMHGLEKETTCTDGLTHVFWASQVGSHPATYSPENMGNFNAPPKPTATSDELYIREYNKHKNFIAHIRNSGTYGTIFNGECAYQHMPEGRLNLTTPFGALIPYEQPPCHFLGRKFAEHTKYQLLYQADEIFRDDVFGLSLSWQEIFNRTIYPRLFYGPPEENTYFVDGGEFYIVLDTEYLKYPAEKRVLLPPFTKEHFDLYPFRSHFTMMGVTVHQKYLFRVKNDNTIWLLYNGTRRVIQDEEAINALGLAGAHIDTVVGQRVAHFLVDPPLNKENVAEFHW